MKEEIYCQNIEANTTFQKQVQVFVTNSIPWHRDFSKFPKFWPFTHAQQILHLLIIPNLHRPWKIFLILYLWWSVNFNFVYYLIMIPLWLQATSIFLNILYGSNWAIFTRITFMWKRVFLFMGLIFRKLSDCYLCFWLAFPLVHNVSCYFISIPHKDCLTP